MYGVIICCLHNTVSGQIVLLLLKMMRFDLDLNTRRHAGNGEKQPDTSRW